MLCALCVGQASALEYTMEAPDDYLFGRPTSDDTIYEWEDPNVDRSKNTALIPPGFGTASADTLNTGTPLTPNLAPGSMPATGAAVNGTSAPVFVPGSTIPTVNTPADPETSAPSTGYTEVTSDLYYSGGHLGTLKIPAIGLTVKVYEGTDSKTLAKGAGHFEETSIWRGNIAVAAHNRGTTILGRSIPWSWGMRSP